MCILQLTVITLFGSDRLIPPKKAKITTKTHQPLLEVHSDHLPLGSAAFQASVRNRNKGRQ